MRRILLFLFPLVVWAQSQPPPNPKVGEAAEKPKQEAGSNQKEAAIFSRGTKEAPLVIEAAESPTKDEDAAKEEARAEAELSTNRWIMWYTLALTVFTAVQLAFYFRHRSEDSRDYVLENRPWLSFDITDWYIVGDKKVAFSITYVNHGRTIAKNVGYRAFAQLVSFDDREVRSLTEPNPWPWNSAQFHLFPTRPDDSGRSPRSLVELDEQYPGSELDKVETRQLALIVAVEVEYTDQWGARHETKGQTMIFGHNGVFGHFIRPRHSVIT